MKSRNILPESLEKEIEKFLEGFHPASIDLTKDGLDAALAHYQKINEKDEDYFKMKFHLAEALRINAKNREKNEI